MIFFYFQPKEADMPEFKEFFDKTNRLLHEWGKDPFGSLLDNI